MFLVDFVTWSPLASMLIFSLVITALLTFLYKILVNQQKYKELKEKQKELQKRVREEKDPEKLAAIQQEMMKVSMENMKMTMKPMLITFIPLLLVFSGLKWLYMDAAKVGNIIFWGASLPIIGDGAGWLLCYIVFSFVFSLIFRKAFGL